MKFPSPCNPCDGIIRIRFEGCILSPELNQSTPSRGQFLLSNNNAVPVTRVAYRGFGFYRGKIIHGATE